MSSIVVINNLTLDGVMQAPGRPDEDTRGGFQHGGWATAGGGDPDVEDNPFTERLNNVRKYVASRTLQEPLPWSNSTLLGGDAADAVAGLRERPGGDIVVMGSGDLVQSLLRRDLVDEFLLVIHPLVLGTGRRLFAEGTSFATMRLVDSLGTGSGVLIAVYQPSRAAG
jgi:dihydrofolate reductase